MKGPHDRAQTKTCTEGVFPIGVPRGAFRYTGVPLFDQRNKACPSTGAGGSPTTIWGVSVSALEPTVVIEKPRVVLVTPEGNICNQSGTKVEPSNYNVYLWKR